MQQSHNNPLRNQTHQPPTPNGRLQPDNIEQNPNKGGGTGILIRNDIIHTCQQVTDLEDQNHGCMLGKNTNWQLIAPHRCELWKTRTSTSRRHKRQVRQTHSPGNPDETTRGNNLDRRLQCKIAIPEDESIQKESRNGKKMMEFIQNTGFIPMSIKPQHGLWTRENRHNPKEKSVIDYILTTPTISTQVNNLVIDEEGTLRLKGKNESDHNTITFKVTGKIRKKTWKKKDMANKQWRSMVHIQQSNGKHPWEQNTGLQHIRKTPQENNGNPPRENNNNTRHNKETK